MISLCKACQKEKAESHGLCLSCYKAIYHADSDLQDKQLWVKRGMEKEWEFVQAVCPMLGLKAAWNLEDPYEPDLWVNNELSELKYKSVPFFKARDLFGIPPQYCLAINIKDYRYYKEMYPNVIIYFWVDWQELEKSLGGEVYRVRPMFAVYRTPFKNLATRIESGEIQSYTIPIRIDDELGNAKGVYVFSAKTLDCLIERML